jgi:(p)ppGpp synthase/HD superfamily hydrolase
MIYTTKMQEAIHFSIQVHEEHQKQKRKGKDIPYITHPLTVGHILALAGAPEAVVVAGLLHDTIEDSALTHKVSKEMIAEQFGNDVADLVHHVTEKNRMLTWHQRKTAALEEIQSFPREAVFVKSADVLSNSTELLRDYEREGDETFHRFHTSKDAMINHSLHTIEALMKAWPENPLNTDLEIVHDDLKKML